MYAYLLCKESFNQSFLSNFSQNSRGSDCNEGGPHATSSGGGNAIDYLRDGLGSHDLTGNQILGGDSSLSDARAKPKTKRSKKKKKSSTLKASESASGQPAYAVRASERGSVPASEVSEEMSEEDDEDEEMDEEEDGELANGELANGGVNGHASGLGDNRVCDTTSTKDHLRSGKVFFPSETVLERQEVHSGRQMVHFENNLSLCYSPEVDDVFSRRISAI